MTDNHPASDIRFFKQKNDEIFFKKNGYLIIEFIDQSIVERLESIYIKYTDENLPKFLYTSHNVNKLDKNLLVSNALKETLSTELHKVFNAYQFIIGHFVVKAANNNSTFPLHQDWNITEEKSFASVHCWIPLQDTFKENGAMHIVPGSHLFFNNYRSGSLSIPRISEQKGYDSLVKEIKLGKGQALIYHPALFHGSYENKTSENRIAILVSLIEKSAPMQYFHATENNEIEIYNFTPEYLLENLPTLEKGVKPQGILPVQTIKNQQTSNNLISFQHLQQKNKESTLNFVKRFIQFWK